MRLQRSYLSSVGLYVMQNDNIEKRPDGSRRLSQIIGSFLDYFPFLAGFLSAFFIFFAIMFSFSRLLLETAFGGTAANLQSLPLLSFYG